MESATARSSGSPVEHLRDTAARAWPVDRSPPPSMLRGRRPSVRTLMRLSRCVACWTTNCAESCPRAPRNGPFVVWQTTSCPPCTKTRTAGLVDGMGRMTGALPCYGLATIRYPAPPRSRTAQRIDGPGQASPLVSEERASIGSAGYASLRIRRNSAATARVPRVSRTTSNLDTVGGGPRRSQPCHDGSEAALSSDHRMSCSSRRNSDWISVATRTRSCWWRNPRSIQPRAGLRTPSSAKRSQLSWTRERSDVAMFA